MIRWLRRFLMILLGGALAGGLVYAFLPQPLPVDMAQVERGPLQVTVDEDGKTRLKERYIVSAPLAGRLQRITLRAGDPIQSGQTRLATVDPVIPELLDPRARTQAELRVKGAEAAVQKSRAALEQARAALNYAESEYARRQQLFERGTSTRAELEEAESLQRIRSEEFRAARFAEEIAQFEQQQAEAALLRTDGGPESESWQFEIRAPITGRVLRVMQESAAVVTAGTPLLEVGNPHDLELEIDVLSSDAVRIHPGGRILLEQWGGDRHLEARVRLVEPSAFTKLSALGVEEQRVYVIADFADPDEVPPNLGDGYRVEARIVTWESPSVLKVPTSALFRHGGGWAVFRVEQDRARLHPVTVGHRSGLEAEVLEGLSEGETVVIHPSDQVRDDLRVVQR